MGHRASYGYGKYGNVIKMKGEETLEYPRNHVQELKIELIL